MSFRLERNTVERVPRSTSFSDRVAIINFILIEAPAVGIIN